MSRFVLQNGNVFDSLSGRLIKNQTIIIKDTKIDWIGPDSSYRKKENDNIIDVSGKIILPGLMDIHVHLEYLHEFIYNIERAILRN
ncbi:MAG: hypothetical protein ACFFB5_22675 [Promethearchaeota archaeon]